MGLPQILEMKSNMSPDSSVRHIEDLAVLALLRRQISVVSRVHAELLLLLLLLLGFQHELFLRRHHVAGQVRTRHWGTHIVRSGSRHRHVRFWGHQGERGHVRQHSSHVEFVVRNKGIQRLVLLVRLVMLFLWLCVCRRLAQCGCHRGRVIGTDLREKEGNIRWSDIIADLCFAPNRRRGRKLTATAATGASLAQELVS